MIKVVNNRLAIRTTVIILAALIVVGSLMIGVGVLMTYRGEKANQARQLHELINTVINTAQIAVFLGDSQLGDEIARGMVGNDSVAGVVILSGSKVLASAGTLGSSGPDKSRYNRPEVITRQIFSPFAEREQIGQIKVISNPRALAEGIKRSTVSVVVIQLGELLVLALCIIFVVMRLVTHPIAAISNRLHDLNISLGEKLPLPGRHRGDEIAQLVSDVNIMIDRVVGLLNTERFLRQEMEVNERKFRSIFENATSAIFLVDHTGSITSHNTAFLRLFQTSRRKLEQPLAVTIFDLVGEKSGELGELIARTFADQGNRKIEIYMETYRPMWLEMVLSPGEEGSVQIIANEITAFKAAVSEVERQTVTDSLTGLGNRLGVIRQLSELLDPNGNASKHPSALLFIDLDRFKAVNDQYGHQAGDTVLCRVAGILQAETRKTDFAARLGGDEFIVVLRGVGDVGIASRFAEDFIARIETPIAIDGDKTVTVGASIGIAFGRPGEISADEFLERADIAMYRAKAQGRHRYCFFEPDSDD